MCGICGIFHYENQKSVERDALAMMNTMLTHRGPDDEGYHIDGPIGNAMRRLIVINPETGHQPLYNEDKSIVLVCNGEIYNFPALRAALVDRGHTFMSRSDCEAIIHLYEELGFECVHRLQGMFAFALWDRNNRRLMIARDRIGIKPLVDALPVSLTKVSFDYQAKRFVSGAELDAEEAHFWWRALFTESDKNDLYSESFKERLTGEQTSGLCKKYFSRSRTDDSLSRMLYVDTRFYLPNDMPVKVDRMTMANALAARVPFLDHEVGAHVFSAVV